MAFVAIALPALGTLATTALPAIGSGLAAGAGALGSGLGAIGSGLGGMASGLGSALGGLPIVGGPLQGILGSTGGAGGLGGLFGNLGGMLSGLGGGGNPMAGAQNAYATMAQNAGLAPNMGIMPGSGPLGPGGISGFFGDGGPISNFANSPFMSGVSDISNFMGRMDRAPGQAAAGGQAAGTQGQQAADRMSLAIGGGGIPGQVQYGLAPGAIDFSGGIPSSIAGGMFGANPYELDIADAIKGADDDDDDESTSSDAVEAALGRTIAPLFPNAP